VYYYRVYNINQVAIKLRLTKIINRPASILYPAGCNMVLTFVSHLLHYRYQDPRPILKP